MQPSGRSQPLDALRGVAILLVISFHWLGFAAGSTGVDLFFVLSGYLLSGILLDNREATTYWSTFYARRAARILPLYVVFLAVVLPLFGSRVSLWHYATMTQNFAQARIGWTGEMPELTLAVEEQFYLILPIMVRFLPQRLFVMLCVLCIIAAPYFRLLFIAAYAHRWAAFVLLPCRMDALFAGVCCACLMRQNRARAWIVCHRGALPAFGAVGILAYLAILHASPQLGSLPVLLGGYSAIAVGYGAVVLWCATAHVRHWPAGLLAPVGQVAYAAYLFHRPVYAAVVGLGIVDEAAATPLAAGALGVLVAATWLCIERPCLRWARATWRYVGSSAIAQQLPLSAHPRSPATVQRG